MLSQGVYTHQSMCVCHTDTCTQTLTHTCMYTHRHTPVHTHRHICTHIAPHLCTHTHKDTHAHKTLQTRTHTHTCAHTETHVHTQTDRCIHTHTLTDTLRIQFWTTGDVSFWIYFQYSNLPSNYLTYKLKFFHKVLRNCHLPFPSPVPFCGPHFLLREWIGFSLHLTNVGHSYSQRSHERRRSKTRGTAFPLSLRSNCGCMTKCYRISI